MDPKRLNMLLDASIPDEDIPAPFGFGALRWVLGKVADVLIQPRCEATTEGLSHAEKLATMDFSEYSEQEIDYLKASAFFDIDSLQSIAERAATEQPAEYISDNVTDFMLC
jgi:hypothetical protein